MKRIFVSLSLVLIVGLTVALASDEPRVSEKVKAAFQKEFAGAQSVTWSDIGDYQMAVFNFKGYRLEAYFNSDAELEGFARNVLFDQLPMVVTRSFDKHFKGADYIDVLEVTNPEGTYYWLTVKVQNKKYRVKADTIGDILLVEKK